MHSMQQAVPIPVDNKVKHVHLNTRALSSELYERVHAIKLFSTNASCGTQPVTWANKDIIQETSIEAWITPPGSP